MGPHIVHEWDYDARPVTCRICRNTRPHTHVFGSLDGLGLRHCDCGLTLDLAYNIVGGNWADPFGVAKPRDERRPIVLIPNMPMPGDTIAEIRARLDDIDWPIIVLDHRWTAS